MALWIVDVKRFYFFLKFLSRFTIFDVKKLSFLQKMLVQIVRIQLKKYFNDILYRLLR